MINKISKLISEFEGFSETPYRDIGGVYTIGHGFTYINGTHVTKNTTPITEEQSLEILKSKIEKDYLKFVKMLSICMTTENQIVAMTSFCYNVGVHAFKHSTLLKKHNLREFEKVENEFLKWQYVNHTKSKGLLKRRIIESKIYKSGKEYI